METAVVLFITAIVAVPLLATAWWVVDLPVKWRANVEAARDAREILRQVADDARQASSFEKCDPQTDNLDNDVDVLCEGTFVWKDYDPKPHQCFTVRYYVRDNVVARGEIREDATKYPCEPAEVSQISEEEKTIGSVAYFGIRPEQVLSGGASRCLIYASVRLSRPENFLNPWMEIAAMMRPDNAECE